MRLTPRIGTYQEKETTFTPLSAGYYSIDFLPKTEGTDEGYSFDFKRKKTFILHANKTGHILNIDPREIFDKDQEEKASRLILYQQRSQEGQVLEKYLRIARNNKLEYLFEYLEMKEGGEDIDETQTISTVL